MSTPLHTPLAHESGLRHATGEARYIDDLPAPPGLLHGFPICSPHAHARIGRVDVSRAERMPGVRAVLFARDIPGVNQVGAVFHDEPLMAVDEVRAEGQIVGLVVAESLALARKAAGAVVVEYQELPALVDLRAAIAEGAFHPHRHVMQRGDVEAALAGSALVLEGEVESGGQEHFYLETHVALALPEEGPALRVLSSSQHPTEVQAKVAEVLGWGRHQVVVEVPRMGGGFGGKETQGAPWAALAALGAVKTGRPVKVWLDRDRDMVQTGKRHPFLTRYKAGFAPDGRILALRAELFANGGWSMDLSHSILDRALFHLGNAYWIPALRFEGRVVKTNLASNTAFRGFGGPQGMLAMEMILDRAAERLRLDPAEIRRRNYLGPAPRNRTPYDQEVPDFRLHRIHDELCASSEYARRKAEIEEFNAKHEFFKRGIAFAPVQFGISFTYSVLNQAGALVLVYQDGTVQVNHGGTEMGQGLHTKIAAVAAHELGVPLEKVRVMTTATDKVPNTSATAASSGSDLNGQAVAEACRTLRARLKPVRDALGPGASFAEVAMEAWRRQISMAATGFYRTPGLHYDAQAGKGKPFHYFAYGGAVVEVEICALTGEHRLRRVDILHDVGNSLVPSIDLGQIEGGFIQGYGWLTCEELVWNEKGRLVTRGPDTYKIPAVGEAPLDFRVKLLERAEQPDVIHGSKAVGEPPLMLAIGAVSALRHAIAAFAQPGHEVQLGIPCTPEAVLRAVEQARLAARLARAQVAEADGGRGGVVGGGEPAVRIQARGE